MPAIPNLVRATRPLQPGSTLLSRDRAPRAFPSGAPTTPYDVVLRRTYSYSSTFPRRPRCPEASYRVSWFLGFCSCPSTSPAPVPYKHGMDGDRHDGLVASCQSCRSPHHMALRHLTLQRSTAALRRLLVLVHPLTATLSQEWHKLGGCSDQVCLCLPASQPPATCRDVHKEPACQIHALYDDSVLTSKMIRTPISVIIHRAS